MLINPNDVTAKFYDYSYAPFKGSEITSLEAELATSLVSQNGSILDIGCGTGRHLELFEQKGFQTYGIDNSQGMLEVAKKKLSKTQLIESDIFEYDFGVLKFDLITLFWNSLNEIALDEKSLNQLFSRLNSLVSQGGKILINSDNPENFDPSCMFLTNEVNKDCYRIKSSWKTRNFDSDTNISNSIEKIEIFDNQNNLLEKFETVITQKWWNQGTLINIAKVYYFEVQKKSLEINDEMYLVFKH